MIASDELEVSKVIRLLPDELLLYVFKFLSLETLLVCENVCKRWRKLAHDSTLWRNFVIVYSGKPGLSEVSEKNLQLISSHGQYIFCLKIQYVYDYSVIKSILEKCFNLVSLELVMCRISKEFEEHIKMWQKLKKINLRNSLLLDNTDFVIEFNEFKYLNHLALSDFGLSSLNCKTLLHCSNLSHILIEKIKNLSLDYIRELLLYKQSTLITLHVYGGESIDDNCLSLLSQCRSLRDLAIIRCENLTDNGLLSLAKLENIKHLQIWNNTNFSEQMLLHTLSSPMLLLLQSLSLSRIKNVSPFIVDVISEYYKSLKFLALYQCPRIINTDYENQLKSKFRSIDVVLY